MTTDHESRRIFLVYGDPDAGTSYLAKRLEENYSCHRLSLDEAYVQFIKAECPIVYFDALRQYIGPHYDAIVRADTYSLAQFGRSFLAEWLLHLRRRVRALSIFHASVVVEGYVLDADCRGALEQDLPDPVEVFPIEVVNQNYFYKGEAITLEQVAALDA
jgi:hypothetical protein